MIYINKEKLQKLLEDEGITPSKFAKKIGISRTQIWRILESKSNPGAEFISKFKQAYPRETFEEYFFTESVA